MKRNKTAKAIETSLVKARLGELVEDTNYETEAHGGTTVHGLTVKGFAKPGDPDPPPFDATGRPTIRDRVDDLLYCAPKPRECGEHVWGDCSYYPLLKQCTTCHRTKPRKRVKLNKLLPIFKDKLFPPTDAMGRYHDMCIVNKKLLLKRSWFARSNGEWQFVDFVLFVKFPKGWLWTGHFSEFKFDSLIREVDPLLEEDVEYDPKAVFNAAQRAIFGKSWGVNGGLKLERLT